MINFLLSLNKFKNMIALSINDRVFAAEFFTSKKALQISPQFLNYSCHYCMASVLSSAEALNFRFEKVGKRTRKINKHRQFVSSSLCGGEYGVCTINSQYAENSTFQKPHLFHWQRFNLPDPVHKFGTCVTWLLYNLDLSVIKVAYSKHPYIRTALLRTFEAEILSYVLIKH